MVQSAFGSAVEFMVRLGIFDTVLPFLLVFTLMFAFLEKTRVLGTEKYMTESDNKRINITRKNLNSMVAFTIAFFVVASTQLVAMISEIVAKLVLVIILIFSFTLVVGAFNKQTDEGFYLTKTWKTIFEVIAFLAIAVIFLESMGWLEKLFDFIGSVWTSEAVAAIIMVLIMAGIIVWLSYSPKPDSAKKKEDSDS